MISSCVDDFHVFKNSNLKFSYLLSYTVSSRYLKVKVHLKLLIPQSKFSVSRKVTLRYQYFTIKRSRNGNENRKLVQTIFFDIRGYFEISLFETSSAYCIVYCRYM